MTAQWIAIVVALAVSLAALLVSVLLARGARRAAAAAVRAAEAAVRANAVTARSETAHARLGALERCLRVYGGLLDFYRTHLHAEDDVARLHEKLEYVDSVRARCEFHQEALAIDDRGASVNADGLHGFLLGRIPERIHAALALGGDELVDAADELHKLLWGAEKRLNRLRAEVEACKHDIRQAAGVHEEPPGPGGKAAPPT